MTQHEKARVSRAEEPEQGAGSRPLTRTICPYCDRAASLVGGDVVYPHRRDLHDKQFWRCAGCRAHVGCHPGTTRPLGRLATAELRQLKMRVHALFDPLWMRDRRHRSEVYRWLADKLGIPATECHVGMFDESRCQQAIAILECVQPDGD